jgi:hypothetical protein
VIGAELDREDYSSILATAIRKGLEPFDVKTDILNQIKLV